MKIYSNLTLKSVTAIALFIACILAKCAAAQGICPNGAMVEEKYCKYFAYYETDRNKTLDVRLGDILGIKMSSETRSIGFVISVSKYPLIKNADIPAAAVDGDRLVRFLIRTQKFDEVIHLADEEVTQDTINYFLETYLPARGMMFKGKARLFIAYSGHGRPSAQGRPAAFVLSAAKDPDKSDGVYKMKQLGDYLESLSGEYFHVLTMVNACFSGGIFSYSAGGGSANEYILPGAYAITAGDKANEVYSLDEKQGSVFFDRFIYGVTRGEADDLLSQEWELQGNTKASLKIGIVRTAVLSDYIGNEFYKVNKSLRRNGEILQLRLPWIGPTQDGNARGGFFFLSDRETSDVSASSRDGEIANIEPYKQYVGISSPSIFGGEQSYAKKVYFPYFGAMPIPGLTEASSSVAKIGEEVALAGASAVGNATSTPQLGIGVGNTKVIEAPPTSPPRAMHSTEIPVGPASSVPGDPGVAVFKPAAIYPIHGYDLSAADGDIDWGTFLRRNRVRFVYSRAISWRGNDSSFKENWAATSKNNIDRGAYFVYDFCKPVRQQIEALKAVVPIKDKSLPIAILLVYPFMESKTQLRCFIADDIDKIRINIAKLAELVHESYGKIPVLWGNHNDLKIFLDDRFKKYMVWLDYWSQSDKTGLKYAGGNPWTIWQYSGNLNVKGVGKNTTGEVFFGTEEQYAQFKIGKSNIALEANPGL